MVKVSIIIPVYNAESFIEECIVSLLNQTLKDCEFIFVNDGSKDESAAIIEGYSKKDNRIILVSQYNQGASVARNTGLAIATGEYLGFVDSDDFLKEDMLETLYNVAIAKQLDIVVSKTILGRDKKYIIKDSIYPPDVVYDNTFSQENFIPDLLKRRPFAVWNKIYRMNFVEEFGIRFPATRTIEEDSMFNLKAFNKAERIMFVNYSGYFYREMTVSESRRFIEKDYYRVAVERYHCDYKKEAGLTIDDKRLQRLTALRFVHRVFYLIFRCATDKTKSWKVRKEYILKMISDKELQKVIEKYSETELEIYGRYQKLIFGIVKGQKLKKMAIVAKAISIVYSPTVSEVLRKINK